MSKSTIILASIFLLASCKKSVFYSESFYECDLAFSDSSQQNPRNSEFQHLLDSIRSAGVVGISMSVYNPVTGIWLGASGKADLYNNIDMRNCSRFRFGSTVKLLTATTVLLLQEEGKLNIDDLLADHLESGHLGKIENAKEASIRQLLQHSSGIFNYIQSLKFQTASLNDLVREWDADDLLQYAHDKSAYFNPGDDVRYSNTNYILLGLMIEEIEQKPLYQVFDERIFQPFGLTATIFAGKDPVPDGIARGYIDLYNKLQVTESTYYSGWDYYTADGGLISNTYDMNQFFRLLMNGQIISPASLSAMLQWQSPIDPDDDFFDMQYGLGIFRMITPQGVCYFHSGDAIGYYANMLYFPDDGTTIIYAANSNYGKIDQVISTKKAIEKILGVTKD